MIFSVVTYIRCQRHRLHCATVGLGNKNVSQYVALIKLINICTIRAVLRDTPSSVSVLPLWMIGGISRLVQW